jgi:hypothetical protein
MSPKLCRSVLTLPDKFTNFYTLYMSEKSGRNGILLLLLYV